ncbi:DMT family transporter [uncultured Alsobacter sp.]|uniref:DMT family transporter n=1 Tax=uncultured Alsobacter sp. TaxID=1748258 RepID=UPI0025DBD578|nr:DMT family transporter [uncultured Alsobacter sp.]
MSRGPGRDDGTLVPIVLAIAAIIVLTVMDAIIKGVSAGRSTIDIVALRYACGFVWALPILAVVRPPRPSADMLKANAMRSIVVLATALFFFYALARLPLVEATTLGYLAPVFMAVLARVILGEPVARATGLAIVLGFAGVVVIAGGRGLGSGGFGGDGLGVAAALAAALAYALSMVLLRARTASDPTVTIVVTQNLFAAAMAVPAAFLLGDPLALLRDETLGVLAIGALGTAGHLLFAEAYKGAPAAKIGAMEYTGFIWAAGIGILAFGEWPTLPMLAGAALIVSGSLMLLRKPSTKAPVTAPADA